METNTQRVLAYQLATEINLEELGELSGAGPSQGITWHLTYGTTGAPGPGIDIGIESDGL